MDWRGNLSFKLALQNAKQAQVTGGWWLLPNHIFAKLDLLRIETNSEKVGNSKNYKLDKNSQNFITTCNYYYY